MKRAGTADTGARAPSSSRLLKAYGMTPPSIRIRFALAWVGLVGVCLRAPHTGVAADDRSAASGGPLTAPPPPIVTPPSAAQLARNEEYRQRKEEARLMAVEAAKAGRESSRRAKSFSRKQGQAASESLPHSLFDVSVVHRENNPPPSSPSPSYGKPP